MSDYITEFVRRKSGVDRNRHVMKPKFRFLAASTDVNVSGLITFIGVEEGTIRTPA
jgi:hypothetical protein